MTEHIGRNDPCPCGSGKKYKKCCELKKSTKQFTYHTMSANEEAVAKKTESKAKALFGNFFKNPEKTPGQEEKPENKE
jgi:uncharacterized protein YchJ